MRPWNRKKLIVGRIVAGTLAALLWPMKVRDRLRNDVPISQIQPRHVLIFEPGLIGDLVLSISTLAAFRNRYPQAQITVISTPVAKAMFQGLDLADELLTFDCPWLSYNYSWKNLKTTWQLVRRLRHQQWDLGIEFRGDLRSIFLMFLVGPQRRVSYNVTGGGSMLTDIVPVNPATIHAHEDNLEVARFLGCVTTGLFPKLALSRQEKQWSRDWLKQHHIDSKCLLVGVHPGASRAIKRWFPERFAQVMESVAEQFPVQFILFTTPTELPFVRAIQKHWCPKQSTSKVIHEPIEFMGSLREFMAVLDRCHILLCLDSGSAHIAAALQKPSVVLYGPVNPDFSGPLSKKSKIVIKEDFPCRPCNSDVCLLSDRNCMDSITVEDVVQVMHSELKQIVVD